MNEIESVGNCERCQRPLSGRLGVFDGELCGVAIITIREISPRNWICCDACGVMLCHSCCSHPASGYCDACIAIYGIQVDMQRKSEPQRESPIATL